jgi:WD40 repeat protein
MFHVIGNEIYIIDSYITSHETQAFHLTGYNTVTKELTEERDIPFEALGMVTNPKANRGKTITCYERTEDGSNMIGTPHGVTSIVNGETTRIYSDPSGKNNSPVLSIKKYNNTIIVGLANGNILMFDENSNNIVRLNADLYAIQGDAVTSLQIVGDQLLASYSTTLYSQGQILIWDLKANQTKPQPPAPLAPTNTKPPVVVSNGLVVLSTSAGTIQIWNPSTRRLMKEFDLYGTINRNSPRQPSSKLSVECSELNDIRRASVECSGDRIIVRVRTGLYELPLPPAE